MPVYTVWETRELDTLGGRGAVRESRGLRVEAVDIQACADEVRRREPDVREFLIVERGHRIPPGGGPLTFYRGVQDNRISLVINEKQLLLMKGAKINR